MYIKLIIYIKLKGKNIIINKYINI
jgi:hypothetical protein